MAIHKKSLWKKKQMFKNADDEDENFKDSVPKKQKRAQKQQQTAERKQNDFLDSDSGLTDEEMIQDDFDDIEPANGTTIQNQNEKRIKMGDVFKNILEKPLRKEFQQNPVFANLTKPLRVVQEEKLQQKLDKGKKFEKMKKENIGRVLPNIVKNKLREKELKMICVKGVAQIFNTIKNYQKENN